MLGVGGSATTDGGAGAIDAIRASGGLRGARLRVLCDVRTPFEDAARVFAPQKGADQDQVKRLTKRLGALARRFEHDPRGVPFTGAAGGLAGGLWSEFGAELVAGAAAVLDELGFDPRMRAARAVVTGEGRLDHQSLAGKAVSEVATRARQAGVPCYAIVGESELDAFGLRILDLQGVKCAGTVARLHAAGRRLGEQLAPPARTGHKCPNISAVGALNPARLLVVAAVVFAFPSVAVGAGRGSKDSPAKRAATAAARAELLRHSDLHGWGDTAAPKKVPPLTCSAFSPSGIKPLGDAASPTFSDGSDGPFVSETAYVYSSASKEQTFWHRAVGRGLESCVADSLTAGSTSTVTFKVSRKRCCHCRGSARATRATASAAAPPRPTARRPSISTCSS